MEKPVVMGTEKGDPRNVGEHRAFLKDFGNSIHSFARYKCQYYVSGCLQGEHGR